MRTMSQMRSILFSIAATAAMLSACAQPSTPEISAGNDAAQADIPPPPPPTPAQRTTTATSAAPGERTAPVVPGRPGRVFIFAGFAADCAPLPPPELSVSRQPTQGDVSFKPGQKTTIVASASNSCKGTKAEGTGVYYTARAGSAGSDEFTVTARMPTGETMTRTFRVSIAQ